MNTKDILKYRIHAPLAALAFYIVIILKLKPSYEFYSFLYKFFPRIKCDNVFLANRLYPSIDTYGNIYVGSFLLTAILSAGSIIYLAYQSPLDVDSFIARPSVKKAILRVCLSPLLYFSYFLFYFYLPDAANNIEGCTWFNENIRNREVSGELNKTYAIIFFVNAVFYYAAIGVAISIKTLKEESWRSLK